MLPAETRKLAAIMFTDMVGFSRQMGADETRMLRLLDLHNQIIEQAVATHRGTVIKTVGDAFLVDFPSVVHAVQCAQQVHTQFRAYNAEKAKDEQIHVRIGIHSGDIVQRNGDVFGDGVNIASRLQALAEPDTVCISDMVYRDVVKKVALGTVVSLGRPKLKNIAERFQVYALLPETPTGWRQTLRLQRRKLSRRVGSAHRVVAAGLVLIAATVVAVRYLSLPPLSTQDSALRTAAAPAALPLPDKPSIVVLPFDNMSSDPQQDYFSNGITDVLTSDLSRISSLFVIARNTAFTYKGKAANIQEVGKELGVRYALECSVQRTSEQVRIVAQLIDTTTGGHLWSERFDRPFTDIFALQDEIVRKIVTTLGLQLTLEEHGVIVRKHTDNLGAYDSFLRGVEYFYRVTQEANAQARQLFEKALALDPQYAEAYARLGWTYYVEWAWRWSADPQTLERELALAHQAVVLDDSLPAAHSLLSWVYGQKQQADQAITEGERAIALDPNNGDFYAGQAEVLSTAGRPEEALRMVAQAMRLNPRYPAWYLIESGWAYRLTGQYAEAIATMKELISRNPNFMTAHLELTSSYLWQWVSQQSPAAQTLEPAVAAGQRALAFNDSFHWNHLYQQQYDQALAEMERSVALAPTEAGSYAALAVVLSCMGRSDEALEAAARALRLKPLIVDGHLADVGIAYVVAGRYEEARPPLQRHLSRYPNFLPGHLMLAVAYSELGQAAEARAEAAEVLRLNPHFLLEVHRQRMPYKDPAMLERHLAALRKAGLK
ncbi:MAG: adenylate/guanylate cyclase domain-containing protein [Deltaproteobacteria bacterium]|nr:adenylate/guanylate cyclase domain-containing protein [Deltaproteobacteria bacterium]